ncbi:MAG: multidrug effflux MFS transporter [Candidatus Lariskella arthropodorum]
MKNKDMFKTLSFPLWIIVLVVGLPLFAETIYTPSLPNIAIELNSTPPIVEFTLTIYLIGFAIGTFFWGHLSDRIGRKNSLLSGLIFFILGCIFCYYSYSITELMISRFIQAFGGSAGSVLGQAICRDAFTGAKLGKVYSIIGVALSIFPAIGPLTGGIIAEHDTWHSIFIVLSAFGVLAAIFVIIMLPETLTKDNRKNIPITGVMLQMRQDRKVLGFAVIIGICNGILFSYFAEGAFYLIKLLGLSPSQYGFSFTMIAVSAMLGGLISNRLQGLIPQIKIMKYGILVMVFSTICFTVFIMIYHFNSTLSESVLIRIIIISQMILRVGATMVVGNALSLGLADYTKCIGTASSIFNFIYYMLISLCTFIMGALHDGTLIPMPLYFLCLTLLMFYIYKIITKELPVRTEPLQIINSTDI